MRWAEFFERYDVRLAPSRSLPAFGTDVESPASIDGVPVDPFFADWCVLALSANLAGSAEWVYAHGAACGMPACAAPTAVLPMEKGRCPW